ncbi:MAG TPA: sigma-70 family RNA polymerase sigma factor [Thermoanaerobaculia bacterium]|nr:sigma-70 family RNA polymerase sigma factor [Thermoanaerobaculia bacterium]
MTPGVPRESTGTTASFEEAYLQFAPLLRKIAVKKYGIPFAEAEPLVHDVFATYFTNAEEVNDVGPYLVGGICNAARHYLRRLDARDAIFCGENPCVAAPTESILYEVERKLLLRRLLSRVGSRCRELLHRYYLIGESTNTIAGALHFKPMTVLICLAKCRKRALAAYHTIMERPQT